MTPPLGAHKAALFAAAGTAGASGSGGTETSYSGYTVHSFLSSGTFTVSGGDLTVDYMVAAGGGGGGSREGGGGGAGGMVDRKSVV